MALRNAWGGPSRGSGNSVMRITATTWPVSPAEGYNDDDILAPPAPVAPAHGKPLDPALDAPFPMARSKSSAAWLQRHVSDPYVKQAQKDGYRSRSAYKLI